MEVSPFFSIAAVKRLRHKGFPMNLVKSKKKEHLRVTAFGDTTKNIQYYIIKTLKIETSLEHEENPNHIMKKTR